MAFDEFSHFYVIDDNLFTHEFVVHISDDELVVIWHKIQPEGLP